MLQRNSSGLAPRSTSAWLLVNDRIQSKANLHRRHVLDEASCDLCGCDTETATHLIFDWPVASSFWALIGIQRQSTFGVRDVHTLPRPSHIPAAHFGTFVLLCCWHLWKQRTASSSVKGARAKPDYGLDDCQAKKEG